MEAAWQHSDEPDACGNPMNVSSGHTDAHSITNETKMAENATRNRVRKHRIRSRTQGSPKAHEIMMPELTY